MLLSNMNCIYWKASFEESSDLRKRPKGIKSHSFCHRVSWREPPTSMLKKLLPPPPHLTALSSEAQKSIRHSTMYILRLSLPVISWGCHADPDQTYWQDEPHYASSKLYGSISNQLEDRRLLRQSQELSHVIIHLSVLSSSVVFRHHQ